MRSFKDYHPENAPSESETLKKAVTAPDPALESSAAELTRKIAAAYNGKNSNEMLRNIPVSYAHLTLPTLATV